VAPSPTLDFEQRREALDARLCGATLQEVAADTGLSVEGTRKMLAREAERQVDALHCRLLASQAVELVLPADGGPELESVLAHLRFVVGQLGARGFPVRPYVVARPTGVAIGLEHVPLEASS
jgi:hypothetical protein